MLGVGWAASSPSKVPGCSRWLVLLKPLQGALGWQQAFSTGRGSEPATLGEGELVLPVDVALTTVWGANTGVGKTLASIGMAYAARIAETPLLYIKPVQTGFPQDSDARLVATASGSPLDLGPHAAHLVPGWSASQSTPAPGTPLRQCKVIHAWAHPVSPHVAVQREGRPVTDEQLRSSIASEVQRFTSWLRQHAHRTTGSTDRALGLVETAGGVASPAPLGALMCDVLRPLRLPALLVGDPRLGGISATLTAYESLLLRGYDVTTILFLDPTAKEGTIPPVEAQLAADGPLSEVATGLGNADALRQHLRDYSVHRLGAPPVKVLELRGCPPAPPGQHAPGAEGAGQGQPGLDPYLQEWLQTTGPCFKAVNKHLLDSHARRLHDLRGLRQRAMDTTWWPFTQHGALTRDAVQVVDARGGEYLHTFQDPQAAAPPTAAEQGARDTAAPPPATLTPLFDACASWWTQTVTSELQPELARAVGYAAGRYLHVINPQVAHQVGVDAASKLLQVAGGDWASRVFFSDDGSTAIEVALKMAFRKYLAGLPQGADNNGQPLELKVVGLENAYHGDTLGAMDCVAPSVFNAPAQAPWYRGRGLFLSPPYLAQQHGAWRVVDPPSWLATTGVDRDPGAAGLGRAAQDTWPDLDGVLSASRDDTALTHVYRQHIESQLNAALRPAADSGSPAGTPHLAALIIEPLVQGAGGMLMIDPQFQRELVKACRARGIPVIYDEVMTGLFRLGRVTAARYLRLAPDIACYAKLMTAGVAPMAATLASEDVFNAFKGNDKLSALLHGHSYTAYPVGCATTLAALDILTSPQHNPNLCTPHGPTATCPTPGTCTGPCGRLRPMWDARRVSALSSHALVDHVIAVGTVFAAKLRATSATAGQAGYGSTSAAEVVTLLRERHGVYARPLGDVVYLMVTPTTRRRKCDELLDGLSAVLTACAEGRVPVRDRLAGEGCVV